ncbi:hypothetical protein BDR07DRAFT_1458580 [Suillus spraguei]|nr:hypothetical protein BDR07DRAFT_1458580 [Suillus spraguei]
MGDCNHSEGATDEVGPLPHDSDKARVELDKGKSTISNGEALKPSEVDEHNNLLHEMKHQKIPKFKTQLETASHMHQMNRRFNPPGISLCLVNLHVYSVMNWDGVTSDSEKTQAICWEVLQCPKEDKARVQGTRSEYDQGFSLKDKSKRFYKNRD